MKLIDPHTIGRLLLETGRIGKKDFAEAVRQSRETGKSPHEILVLSGRVSVDELVQAITIHVDITLLKEALGIDADSKSSTKILRPLGSYLERISLLFKMGILISSETNMSSLVDLLIREAPTVINAERATIFLADQENRELYSHLGVGLKHHQIRIPWESGIAGWVFTHGKSLNIVDPYNDPRFNKDVDPRTGFITKNLLCVPLRSPGGSIIGVFQVLNKRAGVFTATDQEILEILASQAARSMEHALEWDHLRQRASELTEENVGLKQALHYKDPLEEIVGNTAVIQEARALVRKVAPTQTSVLIQGESGTGKELVARAIHKLSPRRDEPLISLNCGAVPSELIESELFGHKKGSFTGAVADHGGVFRSADKGTLFLDEIEATSPSMQVKLLRAIQVGEIRPVGENVSQSVDVRLIAATNRDLHALIDQGLFREDLFYRINVFPITIAPLRERREDIPVLIRHFLDKLSMQTGKVVRGIDPAALDLLMRYSWPGNVRELQNEIERAHIITSDGSGISVRCLSPRLTQSVERIVREKSASGESPKLQDAVDRLEASMILAELEACYGNRSVVAHRLGLSRQGLLNKIRKHGITR
ncbi:MAG TPA: sigma 54-interacting transcriptional regulator [Desulfomonilaceae bacterium]|nr:sigma 54-interacting transcriptional regulator [Desulfomonilaceae bacterium]